MTNTGLSRVDQPAVPVVSGMATGVALFFMAWLALVLTTVSGRLRLIAASFLVFLALLVGIYTFYLVNLA